MAIKKDLCSLGNDNSYVDSKKNDSLTSYVKIDELHAFKEHPFKVENDMELFELMRSIEKEGVIVPLLVRPNPYGDGYEIISGHRRKTACEWAGVEDIPVIIRELDNN